MNFNSGLGGIGLKEDDFGSLFFC